jgi:hypothetical protein
MNVTRDVIIDILPLYFAGQVSADTRALIDDFLTRDPDFARMSKRFDALVSGHLTPPPPGASLERRALQRTRMLLKYRNQMIGLAAGYSLAPLAFVFRGGHVDWIMFRDRPALAAGFAVAAAACWAVAAVLGRRTRNVQNH